MTLSPHAPRPYAGWLAPVLALTLAAGLAACDSSAPAGEVPVTTSASSGSSASRTTPLVVSAPALDVEVVARGLSHGWDVGFLPDGKVLVTERPGRITLLSSGRAGATSTRVAADLGGLYVAGEGGLLGLVVHPDFASTRLFTTCQNHAVGGVAADIRLVTWKLSADGARADRVRDLLTGLPTAVGGRHSGCRPTVAADGALLVGTGDTAVGTIPQDRTSLGGKVLRLDLATGEPLSDNPFAAASDPNERYVFSYGHRNVQGVAVHPGTGAIYTAEHGPSFDDEVNRIVAGGNYGWDPSQGGTVDGYDESVPMTDLTRFPDAVPAAWETGETTQALCAAAFVSGRRWGDLDGTLVVTALKGAKLLFLRLGDTGAVAEISIPEETDGPFGRLRAARVGPDGALYVTTTNGDDDALLRITPAG